MASAPSEPTIVRGRLDAAGRLVSADPELEALQAQAGSRIGQALALPQIAAVAQLARKLGIQVSRPAIAAAADHDLELWVRATPDKDGISLLIEGWQPRAADRWLCEPGCGHRWNTFATAGICPDCRTVTVVRVRAVATSAMDPSTDSVVQSQ